MADLTNLAFLRARSGCSERLGERLLALVRPSRAEPGCRAYEVHQSNDDPDLWMVYENWRSAEDLKAHFALPHMQAFVKDAPAIIDGDFDLRSFRKWSDSGASRAASAATETERLERGLAVLRQIGGKDFDGPINMLSQISPDMARFTVEYPYGDVLSRPGLDLRMRQICTVSSLIAQGSLQPQLKFHMDGLLNVGGQIQDLVEIMLIATAILGFPAAINAIGIVRQLISEHGILFNPAPPTDDDGTSRCGRGLDAMHDLMCCDAADYFASIGQVSRELVQWSVEFLFGDVLSRERLNAREK